MCDLHHQLVGYVTIEHDLGSADGSSNCFENAKEIILDQLPKAMKRAVTCCTIAAACRCKTDL
jgi:hypothetical protein